MISTEERNKLVVNTKANIINKRHHGKITIKTDPSEYAGSIVTIPAVPGCAAFSFNHELIDDTPGRPARVAKRESIGGGVSGFADLDDKIKVAAGVKENVTESKEQLHARVNRKLTKVIEDDSEQALEEFFDSLIG